MSAPGTPGTDDSLKQKTIELYQKMYELTNPLCKSKCNVPQQCCSPEYCEMAIEHAKEKWGVELQRTDHPRLPLMGPSGCTAAPHLRPLCTIHVCEKHFMKVKFSTQYFELRDNIMGADETIR